MSRVDFYIVDSEREAACEAVVCRLADKAWSRGMRLYIRTRDASQAHRLDRLLWTYREDSFLPHSLLADADGDPIVLGTADQPPPADYPMLINLAETADPAATGFERVAEVSCRDPELLRAARQRFRWYRDQGLDPANHTVRPPAGARG